MAKRVVHYINQFYAGFGGEDTASMGLQYQDGHVGPGIALAQALGEDYEIVDGQAKHNEGAYIESDFLMGNNLLLTPGYGNGADHYDKVLADIQAAPLSPYLSFSLDKTDLELWISQLTAVNDQYSATMMCGLYTEAGYQEYIGKLEAAGVYDYLDAVQTQLDAWKAAK